jgi:hypothetical protein
MAFIRSKKTPSGNYGQVVENYRDGQGKHRQRVLVHLGRDVTDLDSAIKKSRLRKRVVSRNLKGARAWAKMSLEGRAQVAKYERQLEHLGKHIEKLKRLKGTIASHHKR